MDNNEIIQIATAKVTEASTIECFEPVSAYITSHVNDEKPWKQIKVKPPFHIVVIGDEDTVKKVRYSKWLAVRYDVNTRWLKTRSKMIKLLMCK